MVALIALALAGQALLLTNPGYFSHDELQWGAFANHPLARLDWKSWMGVEQFQFRPLTFNLWLLIGHGLFAHPLAYHALWVVLGTANGLLLYLLLRRLELPAPYAFAAGLLFVLCPYSAYVHGWVATLADLLWFAALLCIGLLATPPTTPARTAPALRIAAIAAITVLALLSKETAVVIPAACALAWALLPRKQCWLLAACASAVPVIAYLVLRVGAIDAGADGTSYAWSIASIPERWLEYHLYLAMPDAFEPSFVALAPARQRAIAALSCVGLYAIAFRAHWRLGLGLLLGGFVILGPVLVLGFSAGQYGYGFGAVACAIGGAAAWKLRGKRLPLVVLGLLALMTIRHGIGVQRMVRHIGELQACFSPQLAMLTASPSPRPLRLRSEADEDWVYLRLSHEIPGYLGISIRRRVEIVPSGQPTDYRIGADGCIRPLARAD